MSIDPTAYGRQVEPQSLSQGARPGTGAAPDNTGFRRLERAVFGADGLTFGDLIDVINPLQHVPVVSTIYRSMTGDSIAPGPRLAGGGLFGGLIGLASAVVNLAIEQTTGKDLGDHVLALVRGDGGLMGDGFGSTPGALYVADLEPHERVAALLAGGAESAPKAAPDPALAGMPGAPELGSEGAPKPAPEPAPVIAPVIASAPLIDGLDLAGLEPDQRVAALQSPAPAQGSAPAPVVAIAAAESAGAAASSAPRPGAASGSDGAERAPSQPGAGLRDAPFGLLWQPAAYAPGVASASAGAIPSLSSSQWQTLTEALRAYGVRQEAQARPIPLRYDSQQ